MQYNIEVFCDNDLNANTYLIYNDSECLIIDPANNIKTLLKYDSSYFKYILSIITFVYLSSNT